MLRSPPGPRSKVPTTRLPQRQRPHTPSAKALDPKRANPFPVYDREIRRLREHLHGLTARGWSARSHCRGWSVKDVVAHLAAWRRRTVARLEAAGRGQPEPAPEWPIDLRDDDEINSWFHARDRGKSVREVLDRYPMTRVTTLALGPLAKLEAANGHP